MAERLYQMKDLMERFEITRDTIKYYEKKGLINAERSKSGYRLYTEEDMQKLKKILELKSMGFSIKDCEAQLLKKDGESVDIIEVVKKEIEAEIAELRLKLQRLDKYKEHQHTKMGTNTGVKHNAGYALCYGCRKLIEQYSKDGMVCDMYIYSIEDSCEILSVEDTIGVMVSDAAKIHCQCPECLYESVINLPEVYVKFVLDTEGKELGVMVKEACEEAKQQGIQPADKVYCMKNLFEFNGDKNIAFHIFVPQKK